MEIFPVQITHLSYSNRLFSKMLKYIQQSVCEFLTILLGSSPYFYSADALQKETLLKNHIN